MMRSRPRASDRSRIAWGGKLKNRAGWTTECEKHGKAVELHGLVLFVPEK